MSTVPSNLQAFQIWPISAQGAIIRHNPLGDPTIEANYHKALEDGRFLEASIGDANNWLLQKKQQINNQITTYLKMNQLAVDGQLGHTPRVPKFIADSIAILQEVNQFQQQLSSVLQAVTQNIQLLTTMKNSMVSLVQNNLNALANLLNNICNWNLPPLPSIPNVMPGGMLNWNGFQFSPIANFAKAITNPSGGGSITSPPPFNFNFSFSQCNLINLGFNPTTSPASISTYSGLTYNPDTLFIPPLDGTTLPAGTDLTDPAVIAQMQAVTTVPYYNNFNPNSSMLGAVPDPSTIISDYQMPSATYQSNIVSILPQLRNDTVEPTDLDYANPNYTVRNANLRADLVHYVTLEQVVASAFDPWLTSAWLFYLNICRNGRAGSWIANFQAAYIQYVQPSVAYLQNNPIPWNNVLGGLGTEYAGAWDINTPYAMSNVVVFNSTTYIAISPNTGEQPDQNSSVWQTPVTGTNAVYQNTPAAIPLISTLTTAAPAIQGNILWQLSYIEAALLGYTRAKGWDTFGNSNYLSGFTESDLDYQPTTINAMQTTTEILGVGTAAYPVTCTFPTSIKTILDEVIAQATLNISVNTNYQTPYVRFKFVYNQFAESTLVDRYTQFWRTFNFNLTTLLAQDPYLVQFVVTYEGSLDSAVDPLGDLTDYNVLSSDAATRNRNWTPGTPLLNIPIAPVVDYSNPTLPTSQSNGWISPPTELDANAFLARPDIQGQPIPVQQAMLRTNLSYAGLNLFMNQFLSEINAQITNANNLLAANQQLGFQITALNDTTTVPSGMPGTAVQFDQINFDLTGNVTNLTTFTIQALGDYAGYGEVDFNATTAGTYTVTVMQNGTSISTVSSTVTTAGTVNLPFSFTGNFAVGDVVQVIALQNSGSSQDVVPGSYFSMIRTGAVTSNVNSSNTDDTKPFIMDVPFYVSSPVPALTVVQIDTSGNVTPVDPIIPLITNVAESSGNVLTITANNHFSVGAHVVFAGVSNASYLNGIAVTITSLIGSSPNYTGFVATDPSSHGSYPSAAEISGAVLYAITDNTNTNVVLAPIPSGITIAAAAAGETVQVATFYGGLYQVSGVSGSFTDGALLYAGPDGLITQDYATLITEVGWIICVGRVISFTSGVLTFIYEPHLPSRYSSLF